MNKLILNFDDEGKLVSFGGICKARDLQKRAENELL